MRIELDKPLSKTKLKQALKMTGNKKAIKIICGTEIYDIDTITTKGDTIYLHTNSEQTSEFYRTKVISKTDKDKEVQKAIEEALERNDDYPKYDDVTSIPSNKKWEKWKKEVEKNGYVVGDTPPFDSGIT